MNNSFGGLYWHRVNQRVAFRQRRTEVSPPSRENHPRVAAAGKMNGRLSLWRDLALSASLSVWREVSVCVGVKSAAFWECMLGKSASLSVENEHTGCSLVLAKCSKIGVLLMPRGTRLLSPQIPRQMGLWIFFQLEIVRIRVSIVTSLWPRSDCGWKCLKGILSAMSRFDGVCVWC